MKHGPFQETDQALNSFTIILQLRVVTSRVILNSKHGAAVQCGWGMKRLGIDPRSLRAQMIVSFVVLVLLTAIAVGLPAVWMIYDQIVRQAWAQVEQGSRVARTLYEVKIGELQQLAMLTGQRPTLHELLQGGELARLSAYLGVLQAGAGLDSISVCDSAGRLVAQAGTDPAENLCADGDSDGIHVSFQHNAAQVWLRAHHFIDDGLGRPGEGYRVTVGTRVDDAFADAMHAQTGLEYTVLIGDAINATSFDQAASLRKPCPATSSIEPERGCRVTFDQDGAPYFAIRMPLSQRDLEVEIALPVSDVVATQRRLVGTLIFGILLIAVLGSGVGALLARHIGRPLHRLTEAATRLSKGNMSDPVVVDARVREVALVAQALEGARADLARTLEQLHQEKEWVDHLLEAIVEGIVTLDTYGRITYFSHGAEQITGWQRDEVLELPCDYVFQPQEADQSFSELIPRPGRRSKIPVVLRNGHHAILSVTGARLLPPEGFGARVALVFRDVSEEETIHRLLGHFLANVSHEFRTPLAAVAASVELLMDQAPDLSAEELGVLLNSLHLGVLGLQTLVDNLLESASIEAGHFRVSPRSSDLSKIIAEGIHVTQPLLDKRRQPLIVELPMDLPVVDADPRRAVQVLVNLLSNASKYGPDEGEVAIGATVAGDWVRVTVSDRGPGIPAENRKDLFRRFMRTGSNDGRAQYGAGLGLSVVKAIVEAHGGRVGVDDRLGGGSIFWLTLPKSREL